MQTAPTHFVTPIEDITRFCQKWNVREMSLFGSALRDDFGTDSDVDLLVDLTPPYSIEDFMNMQEELESIFGRKVDLLIKRNVERDENYIRRKLILESAQLIYANQG